MYRAKVVVTLKKSVMDPQGATIRSALESLGYSGVDNVRMGKFLEIDIAETTRDKAEKKLDDMCGRLLSNPVIENYTFEMEELK
ncbi:MAG: phosphoribosylformylglycinamidine synthase [Candidatus Raymondbacteria bacterium RifOxyC12_full_50_8]|uniref:Phosphoribosylformylglycinamidine synthase subunit PurS n=1 Tax=Candidatus Raymondbacteria bacterium RIFOXYD12_FULL_49_13 TaxID=1817890 RepID=A0A1F7FHV6_UNCRA|nr:MAG: phosphoribosylformylglycinamidine synthase [Candidatus Raymondbacteria bacterium RIFOXYA2_FULL_49_16]OGJ95681.1 MAG: phosphoribosylformylglycinamidine synthase [Candidatus Raymondbacteria bacterium RifOxyB12_full_50_8]OGK05956.1 MAG: phosphoribosylformylglycinamidine synthase [Candidatus Raymondbacteria bacterium RifOxyC12_full_50_8]OGK06314.1 MAG: phosphoribosylformylglycinamidine synthase [Candidatus Raymondbacteria bacterium RIFOXYD12_FULL_49_13]OGP40647.1 MAG: phosphoribosylformylgl